MILIVKTYNPVKDNTVLNLELKCVVLFCFYIFLPRLGSEFKCFIMKKVKVIVVACCVTLVLLASSCAGSKKVCPAYGKADVEKQDING